MELSHLKEFVVLASHSKLTSAARTMFISPSTLSQHITALEKEVGCALFTRTTDGLMLTREGETALEHAQRILFEYGALMRDCVTEEGVTMRLSVPNYYYGQGPLLAARRAFFETHPHTKVVVTTNEHHGKDPFDILESGLSDTAGLFLMRDSNQRIENIVPPGVEWVRIGAYRCIFLSNGRRSETPDGILTAEELDGSTVTMRLCPVCSLLAEGLTQVLETHNASPRVALRPLTRNTDAFLGTLEDDAFMMWFEPVEGSLGTETPDRPVFRFEHDLLADGYVLYRPDMLNQLQREYLETLRTLHPRGVVLQPSMCHSTKIAC